MSLRDLVPGPVREAVRPLYHLLVSARDRVLKTSRVTLERPVLIWGTGRSGTHLLLDVLSLHPLLACPRARERWKKGLWGTMHWGDSTPERLRGRAVPYEGFQHFWMDTGLSFDLNGLLGRDGIADETVHAIRQGYVKKLRREWFWRGSPAYRILDKTPSFIMMLEAVDKVFPDAFHVFCIRDPRAVLNSYLRTVRFPEKEGSRAMVPETGFWSAMRPPGYEKHVNDPLVSRLSWQIGALMEIGLLSRSFLGDRLVEFCYERLLTDSHASAADLFWRLELPPYPEIAELIPREFANYSPPWPGPDGRVSEPYGRSRCYMDEEIKQLAVVDDLAFRLGYDRYRVGILAEAPIGVGAGSSA